MTTPNRFPAPSYPKPSYSAPTYSGVGSLGTGGSTTASSNTSRPSSPPSPSSKSKRTGSADSAERRQENRGNGLPDIVTQDSDNALFDILNMPANIKPDAAFSMEFGKAPAGVDGEGYPVNRFTGTQMTIGAGLDWFRDLAIHDRDKYNSLVYSLYSAGYLSEGEVRFNSFTSTAGQAFAEAAWDVYSINKTSKGGQVTTLFNHLDALAQGMADSGLGPGSGSGSGGAGAEPPKRTDVWTDEATLKANGRQAAQSLLGRSLTDAEEASFLSTFKEREKAYNDEAWNAQLNGGSVTNRPSPDAAAQQFVGSHMEQEKAGQDMGSYMGVLRNMMGLGSGGIGIG